MRDFDEFNITRAVHERLANTPDPRLKQIMLSLVTHLHDFVRDVDLSFEEWRQGIDFLTRTGHMCDQHRQEFILLSDTLGVSMLVDAINHRMPDNTTETTVLGPFYVEEGLPEFDNGANISPGLEGTPLLVHGTVHAADGTPIAGARVDVWHADTEGFYDVQQLEKVGGLTGRGRLRSDAEGKFHCWTVTPRWYPIPHDGPVGEMLIATARHPNRPAHVHFMIEAPGFETMVTHVFAEGSPWLDSDAVFGVKNSLIREFVPEQPGIAPDGRAMNEPYRQLRYDFGLKKA